MRAGARPAIDGWKRSRILARPVRRSLGGASEDLRRHPPGRHLRRVQPAVCGRQIAGARHRRGVLGTFSEEVLRARRHRGQTAPQISPLALEAVQRIDVLFDIERGINGKSAGERLAMRQELSTPVLADLNNWMQAERAKLSRHSSVAKAMDYTGSTLTGAAPGLAWKVIALSLILSALGHVAFGPLDLTPVNLALALFLRIAS